MAPQVRRSLRSCATFESRCALRSALLTQAAGVIHTDFEKGFIMAEVQSFEDLKELGSEEAVKKAGKLHQKGKTYEVQDGDIMFFKFNT